MVEIVLTDVSKVFRSAIASIFGFKGGVRALDKVSLEIRDGEILSIVGPNGSGKTTLLKAVAGLLKIDEGVIEMGGVAVSDPKRGIHVSPARRNISMLFQATDYALYPHMTSEGNISFPLIVRRMGTRDEIKRRVEETASILRINDEYLLGRFPRNLSAGEKQKVAIGRAIVRNPYINAMLLDEPLSNLDQRYREESRREIKKLLKHFGITAIYVTHDQLEAFLMGDRIAVMNRGRVVQVGTHEELYEKPRNTFIAGFVGQLKMNFLECVLKDDLVMVPGTKIAFKAPREVLSKLVERRARKVILGVRPENVKVRASKAKGFNEALVEFVEFIHPNALIHLKLNGQSIAALTKSTQQLKEDLRVWFKIDFEKTHFFDEKTGERINA